jgi:hypothetical protein
MKLTHRNKKPKPRLINELHKAIIDLNSIDWENQNIPDDKSLFMQYLDSCETPLPKNFEDYRLD